MPPKGGNPRLSDDDLRDIVAFLRTLKRATPVDVASDAGQGPPSTGNTARDDIRMSPLDISLLLPGWIIPSPPPGPEGLAQAQVFESMRPKWKAPPDGVAFADSFFFTTELGAIHAGLVAAALLALLIQVIRSRTTTERRGSLALGFGACLVMTGTWCVLFPFTYLF